MKIFRIFLTCLLACLFLQAAGKNKKVELIEITTPHGVMLIYLYDATPLHKQNFLKLTREKYFDSTTFHRCIKNFVIQGGDPNSKDNNPNNDGQGGPDYKIPAEIKPELKHKYGALGAARDGNPKKESSGSQFYIVVNKAGTGSLDGNYTVFGEVIKGMEVAETIANQPKGAADRPVTNIPMTVKIVNLKPKKIKKKYGVEFKPETLQAS